MDLLVSNWTPLAPGDHGPQRLALSIIVQFLHRPLFVVGSDVGVFQRRRQRVVAEPLLYRPRVDTIHEAVRTEGAVLMPSVA